MKRMLSTSDFNEFKKNSLHCQTDFLSSKCDTMVFGATGGNAYKGSVALDFYAWITHKISKKINFYKSLIKVRQIGITDLSVPPPYLKSKPPVELVV